MKGMFIFVLLATSMYAQTVKSALKDKETVPIITAEQSSKFFKAQSLLLSAHMDTEAAQKKEDALRGAFQSIIQEIQKACGDKYNLQTNNQNDLVCLLKEVKK